jgi:hypothetical protein
MHPERFATARDAVRTAKREEIDRALRELQPDRIALHVSDKILVER